LLRTTLAVSHMAQCLGIILEIDIIDRIRDSGARLMVAEPHTNNNTMTQRLQAARSLTVGVISSWAISLPPFLPQVF
jgi:hypothetical protein